jgi:hypothetical protein
MKLNKCDCGGTPEIEEIYDEDWSFGGPWQVRCPECSTSIIVYISSKEITEMLWNASPQKRREALSHQGEMGAYIIMEKILKSP